MPTVQFNNLEDLATIVTHFDSHPNAKLFLVHDHGVYLMPGSPSLPGKREGMHWVTHAKDCNPDTDPECWENARDLVGGDDFGEDITPAIHVIRACVKEGKGFSIKVSPTSFAFNMGRKLPKSAKVG
jgi:hypothetical protein